MANQTFTRARLKTPNAAAVAGLLFSVLLIVAFALVRISVLADPQEPGSWLQANANTVALAINLVPFAGIAFLWFIGPDKGFERTMPGTPSASCHGPVDAPFELAVDSQRPVIGKG
jgi:hypothetical protein